METTVTKMINNYLVFLLLISNTKLSESERSYTSHYLFLRR